MYLGLLPPQLFKRVHLRHLELQAIDGTCRCGICVGGAGRPLGVSVPCCVCVCTGFCLQLSPRFIVRRFSCSIQVCDQVNARAAKTTLIGHAPAAVALPFANPIDGYIYSSSPVRVGAATCSRAKPPDKPSETRPYQHNSRSKTHAMRQCSGLEDASIPPGCGGLGRRPDRASHVGC